MRLGAICELNSLLGILTYLILYQKSFRWTPREIELFWADDYGPALREKYTREGVVALLEKIKEKVEAVPGERLSFNFT